MNNLQLDQLNSAIKHHLISRNLYPEDKLWRIQESPIAGRGLFANRDIQPGEIILIDYPLLIGPRAGTHFKFHCVICWKLDNLQPCSDGCGLPLCSTECQKSQTHVKECELIRKLSNEDFSTMSSELFRSLTALRSFLLDNTQKDLMTSLACHKGKIHGFEIELVKKCLHLDENQEKFLKTVCMILDANAYASVIQFDQAQISTRGLYPLSSLLNHCCSPNSTHLFNKHQQMIVKASVLIPKDTEIFVTYTSLLWGTSLRRHCQYLTKHFWCFCDRCKDPKEFGACLSGLKCVAENCQGVIFPVEPLNDYSKWQCGDCRTLISSQKVGMMQSALGSLLSNVSCSELNDLITLVKERLDQVIPTKNHIGFELKLKIIWAMGYTKNFFWNDLTVDQLEFKEHLCKEVLEILSNLRLGMCKMRGLLLYEVYRCQLEKCLKTRDSKIINKFKEANKNLLEEASNILKDDITVPPEMICLINSQNGTE